jgi:hypothetical protein
MPAVNLDRKLQCDLEDALSAIQEFAVCLIKLSESDDLEQLYAKTTNRLGWEIARRADFIGATLDIGNPTFGGVPEGPLPDNVVPLHP